MNHFERLAPAEGTSVRVAREIRAALDVGRYPVGAALPGAKTLALTFGVSMPTVRLALTILTVEGRIHVSSRGTVVRDKPVPDHLIPFDPADPLRDVTFTSEPMLLRGSADPRAARILGITATEHVHAAARNAVHKSGALLRTIRLLPHHAIDGIKPRLDPLAPRDTIIDALAAAHGPLTYHDRHGAAPPTTANRAALDAPDLGLVVGLVTSLTRANDGHGLMLDTLHYDARHTEVTTIDGLW